MELADLLIKKNRPEEAVDELLMIIAIDRNYNNGNAYDALLNTFS